MRRDEALLLVLFYLVCRCIGRSCLGHKTEVCFLICFRWKTRGILHADAPPELSLNFVKPWKRILWSWAVAWVFFFLHSLVCHLLSCWLHAWVEWHFGYCISPLFFKGSNRGTVFLYPLLLQVLRMLWWHFPDQRQKTEDSNCRTPEQHTTGEDSEILKIEEDGWALISSSAHPNCSLVFPLLCNVVSLCPTLRVHLTAIYSCQILQLSRAVFIKDKPKGVVLVGSKGQAVVG